MSLIFMYIGSPSDSDQLLADQWRSATRSCRDPLQLERDDLREILEYDSWDDLQDQLAKAKGDHAMSQEFAMLAHGLLKLRTFSDMWMCQVSPRVDTCALWAMIRLVLKVCLRKPLKGAALRALISLSKKKHLLPPTFFRCCVRIAARSTFSAITLQRRPRFRQL